MFGNHVVLPDFSPLFGFDRKDTLTVENIKSSCRFLSIFGQGLPEFALSKPSWLAINGGPAPPVPAIVKFI
jgi:hypothetical protein